MAMTTAGNALAVSGNHEVKLLRALRGGSVTISHGLDVSLKQIEPEGALFRKSAIDFLDGLLSHYVLDGGRLVVAHAGLREEMHGRASAAVRAFALYGDTTGETDEFGLPVRYPWARDYRGRATVVYGHTPVREPAWVNNTVCLDTGCVFGGRLTALRWPERELVSVPAVRVHYEPARPLDWAGVPAAGVPDDGAAEPLDVADVLGRRRVETRLRGAIMIPEGNAAAALEVMSRFAIDPRWLIYLPPTMAPVATTDRSGLLEHPADALAAFSALGVDRVVCEEKHMGSRAVVIVCRTRETGREWFGADGDGVVYTRTGRSFFADEALAAEALARIRAAAGAAGLWEELGDWLALDCEILPWSLKAGELVRGQYAAVGAAARHGLREAAGVLDAALARFAAREPARGPAAARDTPAAARLPAELADLAGRTRERLAAADRFTEAYRPYVWTVSGLADIRVAPFQVLAGAAGTCLDREQTWHLDLARRLAAADPLFIPTRHLVADLTSGGAEMSVTTWWEEITGTGGEGMVVKPVTPVTRGTRGGVVQPGIKCRGPEYLRIIYGPEYPLAGNLERLRERGVGRKRSLALAEFALGVEALERFARREPAFRVHECVFGVLALESEPVDPRL